MSERDFYKVAYEDLVRIQKEIKAEIRASEKPNNCETCNNWDIVNDHCYFIQECHYEPKTEPTISKMEQVDKDTNVLVKDCETCKWGEWYRKGHDITMMDDECGGCCSWNSKWTPKTEPQKLDCRNKDYYSSCKYVDKCNQIACLKALDEFKNEIQTDCAWKKGEK